MTRRLVREDVLGMWDFEWNRSTQKENHLTRAQVADLEAGKIIKTAASGGTEFYLVEEPPEEPMETRHVKCPTCGGKGHLEIRSESKFDQQGKIA